MHLLDMTSNAPGEFVFWQLHYAEQAGVHGTDAPPITNFEIRAGQGPTQTDDCDFMLEVGVDRNGHFTVFKQSNRGSQNVHSQLEQPC